jgi:hypothetical protein
VSPSRSRQTTTKDSEGVGSVVALGMVLATGATSGTLTGSPFEGRPELGLVAAISPAGSVVSPGQEIGSPDGSLQPRFISADALFGGSSILFGQGIASPNKSVQVRVVLSSTGGFAFFSAEAGRAKMDETNATRTRETTLLRKLFPLEAFTSALKGNRDQIRVADEFKFNNMT